MKQINVRIIKLRCISAPRSWSHINNAVVLTIMTFRYIQSLHLMYTGVLISSGTQVQPQVILDPDYLPDCLSVSYDYVHVSSNISRIKGNQTMKFGQLIKYNMKNIFLEKSCTKYGGETIPRPISEKSKLSISLHQHSKILQNLCMFYVKFRTI